MAPLTVRVAAERLGVSYSALKQWIYKGTVRTVRTGGGHHRVPESEVERMLAAHGKAARGGAEPRPAAATTGGARRPHAARGTARRGRVKRPRATGLLVSISGRNQLRGIVEEVRADGLLAQVRLRIGDQRLTAVITRDAVEELKLRGGEDAPAMTSCTGG